MISLLFYYIYYIGTLKDIKWAVKATSVLWSQRFNKKILAFRWDFFNILKKKILETKSDALIALAETQSSPNARNYLLRWVIYSNFINKL